MLFISRKITISTVTTPQESSSVLAALTISPNTRKIVMIDTNKFKTRKSLIIAGMVVIGLLGILAAKEAHAAPFVIHSAMLGPISIPSQPAAPPQVATFHGAIAGHVTAPEAPLVNFAGSHEFNFPLGGQIVIPKNNPPVNISGFQFIHSPMFG
jgi:hypothetical protein